MRTVTRTSSPKSATALDQSATRVAEHFPRVPRPHIEAIMAGLYASLADRPLQMYVANLVEHDTRAVLAHEARQCAPLESPV